MAGPAPAGARLGAAASRWLREAGVAEMEAGLTEAELAETERRFGFEFPDDLRAFLGTALPVRSAAADAESEGVTAFDFPDWRDGDPARLREQVEFPFDTVLEDIERGHWPAAWGRRPTPADAALRVARQRMAGVPRLVPVYAHRYLPSGRATWGHPVLSVLGTDVVYYGADLVDYLRHEFAPEEWEEAHPYDTDERPVVTVSFWRDYL